MAGIFKSALAAAVLAMLGAGAALAHGGGDERGSSAGFEVTRAEAVDLAEAEGIVDVWEVKARRGVWKIEGADANGRKIEVEIDGQSGEIVKVEHYRTVRATP